MFSPLANNKPFINNEVDRNSSSVNAKTNIVGGYRMDSPENDNTFFEQCTDFTVAIQLLVDDRVFNTNIRRDNNIFQIAAGSRWFQIWPCMTGLDNTFLGGAYPDLFPNPATAFSTWVINYRTAAGKDAAFNPDLNSQFTPVEPGKPYTFVFSAGTQHPSGSSAINGVTTTCGWQSRQGQSGNDATSTDGISVIDGGTWYWSVNGYPDTAAPISQTTNNGSVCQMAFWTGSLNESEMRVVSNQQWGEPLDVVNQQPAFHYYFREDYKVNKRTALNGDEIANNSYNNLGTIGNQDWAQFTLADGLNFNYSNTGSLDREIDEFRLRV
jgi:hypothetical protein